MKIYPVVLSGGSGTRLWPMSRTALPKQFLKLTSDWTLFQETLLRVSGMPAAAPPLLMCNQEHRFLVAEQLRLLDMQAHGIFLEPVGRNTAPAAAVAAMAVVAHDPEAILLVLPADHIVKDVPAFHAAVHQAYEAAVRGEIVAFGILPGWAESGYGYIRCGLETCVEGIFRIDAFIEKPDQQTAAGLIESGGCYWNSGMFMFGASVYLEELARLRPDIVRACEDALENTVVDRDFRWLGKMEFSACPSDSIDYALMEHTDLAAVVPVDMGWSDAGSWAALWDSLEKDANGNCLDGDLYLSNVNNSYINADHRLVAAIGVTDLIVVETADAVLVAHKNEAQHVRQIIDHLKAGNRTEHINHRRVYRPWGYYESVDTGDRYQVKRIMVEPGAKLSLQMHYHRAEHWIVVKGTARVTVGDKVMLVSENQSTYIPIGDLHRLENPGKTPLHMIEVQSGGYLGEDDIVRMEDSYNRISMAG